MSRIASAFERPTIAASSRGPERAADLFAVPGTNERAARALRSFVLLTGLGWLGMFVAVGLLYRSAAHDLNFVLGATCMFVGFALSRWAHWRFTRQLERLCMAVGMSELDAHVRARAIVSHLWAPGPRGPGARRMLRDVFEQGRLA